MRVLLTGATGLIGSAILARLVGEGHQVVGVARGARARTLPPAARRICLDMARAREAAVWVPHLVGIEAVINCTGVLQDSPSDDTWGVHTAGAAALFEACERAGVSRVIHISAIGVDRAAPTPFSRSKQAGDAALAGRRLDWVILRPSVVLGRAAFGGSALMRGLAALPVFPETPDTGPLQVVQLDDVVETVVFFLRPGAPARIALDIAGPEQLTFADVVAAYRRWLGWRKARVVRIPRWGARIAAGLGDIAGQLGWRPSLRRTALAEIARGAVGDPSEWRRITGITPRSLTAALAAEPASVQERWFARLYLLKPLMLVGFALFWIATGIIALGPGWQSGIELVRQAEIADDIAPSLTFAGAAADILIGAGILLRRTARLALLAALIVSAAYLAVASVLMPGLWSDPLGTLLKIVPVALLNLALLAILDDR